MPYEEEVATPSTSKEPEISAIISELGKFTEILHGVIEELTAKLEPIMKEEAEEKEKEAEGPPSCSTKMAQSIYEKDLAVRGTTKKLRKLIKRLEI